MSYSYPKINVKIKIFVVNLFQVLLKVSIFVINFCINSLSFLVTSMLVTDVGDQIWWWHVLDVGDRFRMLVTDLIHWENQQHNEKSRQHNDSATDI